MEGIEGSGKTTQLAALAARLDGMGFSVRLTREPGGTPIGDAIRAILLQPNHSDMASLTELLLIGACRAQHVAQVLLPALNCGEIVLCDRFSDATLAYQGYGRGLDLELVRSVDAAATGGLKPRLTLLLDCPVTVGLERSWSRLKAEGKTHQEARFEREEKSFHLRVREGYLDLARRDPGRFRVIDGEQGSEAVQAEMWSHVTGLLAV